MPQGELSKVPGGLQGEWETACRPPTTADGHLTCDGLVKTLRSAHQ